MGFDDMGEISTVRGWDFTQPLLKIKFSLPAADQTMAQ